MKLRAALRLKNEKHPPVSRQPDSRRRHRKGVTMAETLIVVAVLGTMLSIGWPRANDGIRQRRVIAAGNALSADIPVAFSLAARQRKPVELTYDASSGELRVTDRADGTVYLRRALRGESEYMLDIVSMTPASVLILPNGTSSSAFTITFANGTFIRELSVSRTGLSRVTVQ
jgi:Tfp pilus assembly protein FimT